MPAALRDAVPVSGTNDAPVSAPTPDNWLSIAALGLIWGGTFAVVAVALEGYGPFTVAASRTALGAVALCALAAALRRPPPRMTPVLAAFLAALGVLNAALPFTLLAWGQQHVASAFAGLSMAMLPLAILPLSHVFVPGDRMTVCKTSGFVLGIVGAALLFLPAFGDGGSELAAAGRLACLGAVLSYAVSSILTRRCPPMDPIWLSAAILVAGTLSLLPVAVWREGLPGPAAPGPMAAILFLGLIPTGLAALLRVRVIRTAGPSFMTLVNYQVPVWSMVFGAALLGEALPPRFFVALALILAGLMVSQWATLAGLRRRP